MLTKFKEKLFHYMFFTFCLSGCLYQIIKICEIYFSYKTTTFVTYDKMSLISLPAITICIDKQYMFKTEYLDKNPINISDKQSLNTLFFSLTIRQQMDILYDFEDVFKYSTLLKKKAFNKSHSNIVSDHSINASKISKVIKSIGINRYVYYKKNIKSIKISL